MYLMYVMIYFSSSVANQKKEMSHDHHMMGHDGHDMHAAGIETTTMHDHAAMMKEATTVHNHGDGGMMMMMQVYIVLIYGNALISTKTITTFMQIRRCTSMPITQLLSYSNNGTFNLLVPWWDPASEFFSWLSFTKD